MRIRVWTRSIAKALPVCLGLLANPYSAHAQTTYSSDDQLCLQLQCLFMPAEVFYTIPDGSRNAFHVYFAKEFPTNIASFYFRKADSTMWAKIDGKYRLLGPPLNAALVKAMGNVNLVKLGRTRNRELLASFHYSLTNELSNANSSNDRSSAAANSSNNRSSAAANSSNDGVGAALLGLGALWIWSEAAENRAKYKEAEEQQDCMLRCKLSRGRCVELCTSR